MKKEDCNTFIKALDVESDSFMKADNEALAEIGARRKRLDGDIVAAEQSQQAVADMFQQNRQQGRMDEIEQKQSSIESKQSDIETKLWMNGIHFP